MIKRRALAASEHVRQNMKKAIAASKQRERTSVATSGACVGTDCTCVCVGCCSGNGMFALNTPTRHLSALLCILSVSGGSTETYITVGPEQQPSRTDETPSKNAPKINSVAQAAMNLKNAQGEVIVKTRPQSKCTIS